MQEGPEGPEGLVPLEGPPKGEYLGPGQRSFGRTSGPEGPEGLAPSGGTPEGLAPSGEAAKDLMPSNRTPAKWWRHGICGCYEDGQNGATILAFIVCALMMHQLTVQPKLPLRGLVCSSHVVLLRMAALRSYWRSCGSRQLDDLRRSIPDLLPRVRPPARPSSI